MANCHDCGRNPMQGHTEDCAAKRYPHAWTRYRVRKRAESSRAIDLCVCSHFHRGSDCIWCACPEANFVPHPQPRLETADAGE